MPRIPQIDRLEGQRHLQELTQLGDTILIVHAPAAHGEDDIIVVETFGIAITVKSVGHRVTTSFGASTQASGLVTRPIPMLVLASANS